MPHPTGQLLSGPATNGSASAKFGTHIDYLGHGGYRSVATLALRDAIPTKGAIEFDGLGSGMRRNLMLVAVEETATIYILAIAGYDAMSDADRVTALKDSTNWLEIKDFIGTEPGPFQPYRGEYDPATTYAVGDYISFIGNLHRCLISTEHDPEYFEEDPDTGEQIIYWELILGINVKQKRGILNNYFLRGDNPVATIQEAEGYVKGLVREIQFDINNNVVPFIARQGYLYFGNGKLAKYRGDDGHTITTFDPDNETTRWRVITENPVKVTPGTQFIAVLGQTEVV